VEQRLAGDVTPQVLAEHGGDSIKVRRGCAGDVRGNNHPLALVQRMVGRKRFAVEYVEPRSRNPSLAKCREEGRLLHNGAARDVDKHRGRLHRPELAFAEQPPGLGGQRQEDDDVVGFAQDVQQAVRREHARDVWQRARDPPDADDAHAERGRTSGERGADLTQPEDRQRAAGDLVARARGAVPPTRQLVPQARVQTTREREDQRHHVLRHRAVRADGARENDSAVPDARQGQKLIDAGGKPVDPPEPRGGRHERGGDAVSGDDFRVARAVERLTRAIREDDVERWGRGPRGVREPVPDPQGHRRIDEQEHGTRRHRARGCHAPEIAACDASSPAPSRTARESRASKAPRGATSTGTPLRNAIASPERGETRAPGNTTPIKFSGSAADTTTSRVSSGERRTARSASTASGRANCSPVNPATNRPPRSAPCASQRR
jgi:hypothetical protein